MTRSTYKSPRRTSAVNRPSCDDGRSENLVILFEDTFWNYYAACCESNTRELLTKRLKDRPSTGGMRICPAVDSGGSESSHSK